MKNLKTLYIQKPTYCSLI